MINLSGKITHSFLIYKTFCKKNIKNPWGIPFWISGRAEFCPSLQERRKKERCGSGKPALQRYRGNIPGAALLRTGSVPTPSRSTSAWRRYGEKLFLAYRKVD